MLLETLVSHYDIDYIKSRLHIKINFLHCNISYLGLPRQTAIDYIWEMKNITIKDVAQLAGVSTATVSRALNRDPSVKAETQQMIEDACTRLGYSSDRAARRLRTGETRVIAFLMHREDPSDKFLRQLLLGLTDRLILDDYHLIIIPEQEISELGSIEYLSKSRTCDGVILTHTRQSDMRVQWLINQQFPFITHGQTALMNPHAYVDYDHETFLDESVALLRDEGATKIAILLPPNDRFDSQVMMTKVRSMAESIFASEITAIDNFPPDMTSADLTAWAIQTGKKFDGIVCYTDNFVNGLTNGFHEINREVGYTVHIATRVHGMTRSHLTTDVHTFHQDLYEDGKLLAEGIIAQLRDSSQQPMQILSKAKVNHPSLEVLL